MTGSAWRRAATVVVGIVLTGAVTATVAVPTAVLLGSPRLAAVPAIFTATVLVYVGVIEDVAAGVVEVVEEHPALRGGRA